MQNSKEGRLNIFQLKMAMEVVVRAVDVLAHPAFDDISVVDYGIAWYPIEILVKTIQSESGSSPSSEDNARLHRLHLMLVSSISSVGMELLPRLMDQVRNILLSLPSSQDKGELVVGIYREIMEKAGDQQKAWLIRWWGEMTMTGSLDSHDGDGTLKKEVDGGVGQVLARL
jgi:hypothetical protein